MNQNEFFDMPIICRIDDGRTENTLNGDQYTTAREIWTKAPRAQARKATAKGVQGVAIHATGKKFHIFQVSGYTPERGIFCDMLNEDGKVIKTY